VRVKIGLDPLVLPWLEVVPVAPHQAQQTAVTGSISRQQARKWRLARRTT
jgi:hypothetical protein